MSRLRVIEHEGDRIRAGTWRGDTTIGYLAPLIGGPVPQVDTVKRGLEELRGAGHRSVLTSALTVEEQLPFVAAGFEVRERLHLLSYDLRPAARGAAGDPEVVGPSTTPTMTARQTRTRTRRARRLDRGAVLAVDHAAFAPFWRLDRAGLREALGATPVTRFRVAVDDGEMVGYAVTGRTHDQGYLQRLAVRPDRQDRGIGTSLVIDGLSWLRRRQMTAAIVNTQESNTAALALYERMGFRRQEQGLAVLQRPVGGVAR